MVESRRAHQQKALLSTLVIFVLCLSHLSRAQSAEQLKDLIHRSQGVQDQLTLENTLDILQQEKQLQDELHAYNGVNLNETDMTPHSEEEDVDVSGLFEDELLSSSNKEDNTLINNDSEIKQTEMFDLPEDTINMLQAEAIPISRFRQNQERLKREAESKKSTQQGETTNHDVDFTDVIPIAETKFVSHEADDFENRKIVNVIRQNQHSFQQGQEEIERRQREIKERQMHLDSQFQIESSDVDDDLRKIVNPSLLKDVLSHENKEQDKTDMFAKLEQQQKEREQEAFKMTQKINEEERLKEEKIKRDLLLASQREKEVLDEIRRQKMEELKIQQLRQQEEARIQAQAEEEERQRQDEEKERQRKEEEQQKLLVEQEEEKRRQELFEKLQAEREAKQAEEEREERARLYQKKVERDQEEEQKRIEEEKARVEAERFAKFQEQAEAQAKRNAEIEAEANRQAQLDAEEQAEDQQQAELDAEEQAESDRQAQIQADEEAQRQAEIAAEQQAEADRQAQEQAEADAASQAQDEAQAEAQRQAQIDADSEAQRQAELQAQAEALKKYEEDQRRQEEELKNQEEEQRRQEEELRRQEEEAKKQQQQEEEEYQRQQEQYEAEQKRLEEEKQKLEEEERSIEQESHSEESQQESEDETEHNEEQSNSGNTTQSNEAPTETVQTNVQTESLKDIEDKKRQQLREQKQKAKENKNNASFGTVTNANLEEQEDTSVLTAKSSTLDPNLTQEEQVAQLMDENSEYITQVDEFGQSFTFKKAFRKIPLVLPGQMQDNNSASLAGMKVETKITNEIANQAGVKLQTKITNESGRHLNKHEIKEQRNRAEAFKFVSSQQSNPDGDKIDTHTQNVSTPSDSSSLVTNVAVLCSDKNKAQSKAVQHACELCEVGEVFQLTEDNWFKIGLAHNHKKEYQDLLNSVNTVFGKLNLIAGFSQHGDICLASDQIFNPVTIDVALKTFTKHSLSEFQLKSHKVVDFQPQHQVNEISFKTSFNKDKKNGEDVLVPDYDQFMMIIEGQFFRKIDSSTNLSILNIVFLQTKLTTFYFGQISINSYSTKVHFQHDIDDRENDSVNIVTDLPSENITFQRQAFKMFNQDNLQNIVQNMQIPRGIQSIENVKIESMLISLNLPQNSYSIILNYESIADFSLNLNLDLKDCFGWVMVRKDAESNQYFLDSNNLICQSEQYPSYSRVHIKKTNTNCYYFIRFADDEYLFHQINQDVFQKILESSVPDTVFEDSLKGLINFSEVYLHELAVEIYFEPKIIYDAKANVGSQKLKTVGNFQAKFTRINGKMNTFASYTFGAENLSDLIQQEKTDLEQTKPKSLFVFFAEQELNTKDMPYLAAGSFGPHEETVWNQGVYVQYVFDLDDKGCFICELLNTHNVEMKDQHIKGYYQNSEVVLVGPIQQDIQVADPIKLDNILLYLPISLNGGFVRSDASLSKSEALSELGFGKFYISSEFNIAVQDNTHFRFLGILSQSQKKQALLIAEAPQPWSGAFDQENLLLSKILFKGEVNEKSYIVSSYTINTLSMFGDNCFVELVEDPLPRFDTGKCFFGNSQLQINSKDFNSNLLVSYINQISSQNILQVLLGYNQAEYSTQVSKTITGMTFPKGLAVSYTKSVIKDESGLVKSPKGYTLTGYAELLGLKGHIVLNVNQNKYLLGIFKFDELTIAGGNIVIVETEGGHDNDIILRLKKDSRQLNDVNQVYFNPKAFIFNKQRNIQISISKDQGYSIDVLDKFFGSEDDIAVRLSAPFNGDIKQTQFRMASMFTSQHISRINALLLKKTQDWIDHTAQLFVDLAQRVSEVQRDVININKELCDSETCPFHQQCQGTPRSECVKYHQKQVCAAETNICLEEKVVCEQEQKICSETAVTCNKFNEADPTVCDEYEENCVEEIVICNKYSSQCLSDEIKICTKNAFVDDLERCVERQMVCDVEIVQDKNCQEECDRKKEEFDLKSVIFDKFTNALNNFQKRNSKFSQMLNYAAENPTTFISIIDAKFQQDLTEFVNDEQLSIDFSIQSFTILENVGKDIQTYVVDQYDFRNEDLMIRRLFKQIQQNWVTKYSLDDVLITSESPIILHDILNKIVDLAEKDADCEEMQVLLQLDAKMLPAKQGAKAKANKSNNNKKK